MLIGFAAYSAYLAISAYAKYANMLPSFEGIFQNWKRQVIVDVQAVATNGACPTDYSPAMHYNWPGTVEGCDCRNIAQTNPSQGAGEVQKQLHRQPCSEAMTSVGCVAVPAVAAKQLTIFNNYKLCAKTKLGVTFESSYSNITDDGNCKSGFRTCGGKTDKRNRICLSLQDFPDDCPVMDISSTMQDGYTQLGTSGVYISKDGDIERAPLVELQLNEEGVCKDKATITTTEGDNHPFMVKPLTKCSKFDKFFESFGNEESRVDFFTNNGIQMTTPPDLGDYVKSSQKIRAFRRGIQGIKPECRSQVPKIINYKKEVDRIKSSQLAVLITGSTVGAVIGIFYTIIDVIVLLNLQSAQKCKKCFDMRRWVNLVVKLAHIGVLIWALSISKSVKNFFDDLEDRECGSKAVNEEFDAVEGGVARYIYNRNLTSLIIACVMLSIDLLFMFILCKCGGTKHDDEAPKQNPKPASANENKYAIVANEKENLQMPEPGVTIEVKPEGDHEPPAP